MIDYKTLWEGEYISVITPTEKKLKYECVHEPDCIMVIPIIKVKNRYYIGIRSEFCPPYIIKDKNNTTHFYTLITGRIDGDETAIEAMERELIEEAGIELNDYKIINHREYMPLCKSTNLRIDFYILLIDSFTPVEAVGDGTENEKLSKTIFVNINKLKSIIEKPNTDFLLYSSYNILINAMNF